MSLSQPLSKTETVTIEKLVYEGDGLGHLPSGEVIFVPWTAPGDDIEVENIQHQKRLATGKLTKIIQPGPGRISPPCEVFTTCGGCQWQHIKLSEQRLWKQKIVVESFQRLGRLPDVQVNPIQGSDEPASWHYRNKVQWVVIEGREGYQLGYQQFRSHDKVAFQSCWIIPERFNQLAHWLMDDAQDILAKAYRIQVRKNHADQILLTFFLEDPSDPTAIESFLKPIEPLTEAFPEIVGVISIQNQQESILFGQESLQETLDDIIFPVSSQSFFQVNPEVTRMLLDFVGQWLPDRMGSLMDLYAGIGLFSLSFHQRAETLYAIESDPHALANAEEALALNDVHNIQLLRGDTEAVLQTFTEPVDMAVVDPPRNGCPQGVLNWISQNVSQRLIYVSCNPATLARDVARLVALGWQIEAVQPFDMFPQTYHIETVTVLKPAKTG